MNDPTATTAQTAEAQPSGPGDDAYPLEVLINATLAPLDDDAGAEAAVPRKTLQDLEWGKVLGHLGQKTVTPEGSQLVEDLPALAERGAIERRLREVDEAMELIDEDDEPPLRGLHDIRRALDHVDREGRLVADDLEAVGRNCDVASRIKRFLKNRRKRSPFLAAIGADLAPCDDLREALNHAIEPGGRLSDKASPDIKRLRRAVQNQHDRLKSRIDSMLRSSDLEDYLQDDYYTIREDRYVLPVRVGEKSQVPGIVHGYSASGQTAFIEPRELVEINNQLRWAQIELEEEENRVLERLSRLVAEHTGALRRNIRLLTYLDIVVASARFGLETLDGTIPEITERELVLKELRHPLLWIQNRRFVDDREENDTVTNDVYIEPDKNVLVVSGPNTGGKTVALKALGLSSLMARCGLPVPAEAGSQVPMYDEIYTDIGDEQSIEQDLSTFSGHLTNINSFLDKTTPDSLVLLDELFTGTDPLEGAALATALLEELAERGATTVVTTHLEGLKTLALQSDTFANASMGFDLDELEPTYRMTMGVPGSSFALRIADRLGFPHRLVERATEVLEGEEHHGVDEVIASLEDRMTDLRKERERMEEARKEARQREEKYRKKYEKLRDKERDMVHDETKELKDKLVEAREQIREKIRTLQQAGRVERGDASAGKGNRAGNDLEQKDLNAMQEELQEVEETVEEATERTKPPETGPAGLVRVPADELEEGMDVYVHSYKRKGTINRYSEGDDELQVQLGALKVMVDVDDVYFPSEKERRSHMRGRQDGGSESKNNNSGRSGNAGEKDKVSPPRTDETTLDIRGSRAHEATDRVANFLDDKFLNGFEAVLIIHGKGTGALRREVRDYLRNSPYVHEWRPGDRDEGGDGVTVVELAEEIHG